MASDRRGPRGIVILCGRHRQFRVARQRTERRGAGAPDRADRKGPVSGAAGRRQGIEMIVVYDADCGVCQASVAWLRKRDRKGVFQFVGNDLAQLPSGVSREETEHTMIVLDGARKLVRAEGVARVLRELPAWA
ncbi:MAG: DUF393 domain-containing protein, partial [Deltaproteobacteria bacterium]